MTLPCFFTYFHSQHYLHHISALHTYAVSLSHRRPLILLITFLSLIPCFECPGVTFCLLPLSLSGKAMEHTTVIVLHELARRGPRL
jgi:hypothetical protein